MEKKKEIKESVRKEIDRIETHEAVIVPEKDYEEVIEHAIRTLEPGTKEGIRFQDFLILLDENFGVNPIKAAKIAVKMLEPEAARVPREIKIKNPIIEVRDKEDKTAIYLKEGLYKIITHLVFMADPNLFREFDLEHVDIYLNDEKIDKPIEMEDLDTKG